MSGVLEVSRRDRPSAACRLALAAWLWVGLGWSFMLVAAPRPQQARPTPPPAAQRPQTAADEAAAGDEGSDQDGTAAESQGAEGRERPDASRGTVEADPGPILERVRRDWAGTPIVDQLPQPPTISAEEPFQPPTDGRTVRVATADEFQAALDDARPGDTILLEAGREFIGNFVLRKKEGSSWIHVMSSRWRELPPVGVRVSPATAPLMPKLVTPNQFSVLRTELAAHHYRLVGLEVTNQDMPEDQRVYTLITLGYGEGIEEATTVEQLPSDIVIDRCLIHGTPTTNVRRGILLNGVRVSVQDSHVSECHERGPDAQAIMCTNGAGPTRIINNYLEASSENILFGGGDPHIRGLVPADAVIRFNRMSKPWRWKKDHPEYAGVGWTVKNIFELKAASRFWVDSNLLENNWLHAQQGMAVLITVRNSTDAPWTMIRDVIFSNNLIQHASSGIGISATDDIHPSESTQRVLMFGNGMLDISSTQYGGQGTLFGFSSSSATHDCRSIVAVNNTALHSDDGRTAVSFEGVGPFTRGFLFGNNIVSSGRYGIHGSAVGVGNAAINSFTPGGLVAGNIVVGPHASAASFGGKNQIRSGNSNQASFGFGSRAPTAPPGDDRPAPRIGANPADLLYRMHWVARGDRRGLDPALPREPGP